MGDKPRALLALLALLDKVEAWFCVETGLWPRDEAFNDDGEPCNVGLPTQWMPSPPRHRSSDMTRRTSYGPPIHVPRPSKNTMPPTKRAGKQQAQSLSRGKKPITLAVMPAHLKREEDR